MLDPVIETSPLSRFYEARRRWISNADAGDAPKSVYFPRIVIPRGGLIAIEGVSGAGKSTLLNLLAGLDEATGVNGQAASILLRLRGYGNAVDCVDVVKDHNDLPRHRIGFIFQQGHLLTNVPVGVNVALPALAHAFQLQQLGKRALDDHRIEELLEELNLSPSSTFRSRRAYQLSGGEAQRVAFARAIAHDPDLVFADEPTSSLDEDNARTLILWLRKWLSVSQDRTVLWVTHHRQLAREMADSILTLSKFGEDEVGDMPALIPRPNRPIDIPTGAGRIDPQVYVSRSFTPAPRKIGRMIALPELLASRRALKAKPGQRSLSAWLSPIRSRSKDRPSLLRIFPAMLSAYSDARAALMFVLSGFLVFIAVAAFLVNERIQGRVLSDPLSCRLEISRKVGPAQRTMPRSVVAALAERPWQKANSSETTAGSSTIETGYPPADCTSGPAAFGQILVINYGLGAIINGKCEDGRQAPRILVAPHNEPLFRRVELADQLAFSDRRPHNIYDREFDPSLPDRNDIYLTYETYQRLRESLGARLSQGTKIDEICLFERENADAMDPDERKILSVGGIVSDLPTIGIRRYDAFVSDAVFQRVLQARAIGGDFEKAVIYFNPLDVDAVAAHLADNNVNVDDSDRQSFHFSQEALKKIKTMVANSRVARIFILVLSAALSAIFLFYLSNWFNSYMETNVKPLSVIKSFGVRHGILRRIVFFRAMCNLLVGLIVIGVIVGSIAAGCFVMPDTFAPLLDALQSSDLVDWPLLASAMGLTIAILVSVMAAVSYWTARSWVRQNKFVAMNLQ